MHRIRGLGSTCLNASDSEKTRTEHFVNHSTFYVVTGNGAVFVSEVTVVRTSLDERGTIGHDLRISRY